MSEQLTAALTVAVAPTDGSGQSAKMVYTLRAESHTKVLARTIRVPAGQTDVAVQLPDFTTISLISIKTDNPFAIKYDVNTNTPRDVRKVMLDTPNRTPIASLFVTTDTLPVVFDLLVVGD